MAIEFVLYLERPVERHALARALLNGKIKIQDHLNAYGDSWLEAEDDPYISASPEECYIRVEATVAPSGRTRMTYRTLLRIYDAYWTVLYLSRMENEGTMRITVADQVAGYGIIRVKDPTKPG